MSPLISGFKLILLPPGLLLILAIIGLLFHKRRCGFMISLLSLLLLSCLSLPVIVNYWAKFWERVPVLAIEQVSQFKPQALVVIGGGFDRNGSEYGSPLTLNIRSLSRVRYAAKLGRELALPILVSGGGVSSASEVINTSEALLMADALEQEFITPVAWIEPNSRNTAENAQFSRALLAEIGVDKIVLVTQAYHMPRAVSEFRKAGFQVLPAPTAFIGRDLGMDVLDWLPSPNALMNSFLLAYEGFATLWYGIKD